ncbi:response regulator transcription factor [Arcticibacterium luteifluviistationis]|uniref:Response regulator n=1 Tax=Arcticibacterium luteifluviistationis TaxID=1784714 RepID=A0A2Z4G6R0_9BACT|nr:response regulator [Arcticibacterium luteifluviistationis]AWV96838.1 response regulator [Arcticibacterium luteifluviistationis]
MNILLIEDDILLLKTVEYKLTKNGFDVETCKNGYDATAYLDANTPDLIVTDIMMPFINGLEIVSYVRNILKRDTPIIMLSCAGLEKTVLEAFELGADDFITKPFSPNELIIRINKNLATRKVIKNT